MKVKFNGNITGISTGDSITKIEIALPINGESLDSAIDANRVISIADSEEISAFRNEGVIKETSIPDALHPVWHRVSINVTGDANSYIKINGITIYTGVLGISSVKIIQLYAVNISDAPAACYFSNLTHNGISIEPFSSTTGWTLSAGCSLTLNQTQLGKSCVKLIEPSFTDSSYEKVVPSNLTGLFEVDLYALNTHYAFLALGPIADWTGGYVQVGFSKAVFEYMRITENNQLLNPFYNITPLIRITESRNGSGEYSGDWTSGELIPASLISSYWGAPTITNNSHIITISWTAPEKPGVGYYIYRYTLPDIQNATYIGYTTTLNFIDTTAAVGTEYCYEVRTTDLFQEGVNYQSANIIA